MSRKNCENLVLYNTLALSQHKSLNLDNPFKKSNSELHDKTPSTQDNKFDKISYIPQEDCSEKFERLDQWKFKEAFDEIQAEYDNLDEAFESSNSSYTKSSTFIEQPKIQK